MVALWITLGLIVSTLCVSILGAAFSIVGIGALFSGALLAVWAMAASMELAKFVLAAYVHQRWVHLNLVFKSYMIFAIVVLSLITSMGIFGFLSDAYQSASIAMDAGNFKLEAQKTQLANYKNEIARLNKGIDEIPESRVSRKMRARADADPAILLLNQKIETVEKEISVSNLEMLEIKKKVGPLIYISRAFNIDIDDVVKYLILVLVSVFDPLAICLVIAMSQALDSRRKYKEDLKKAQANQVNVVASTAVAVETPAATAPVAEPVAAPFVEVATATPPEPVETPAEPAAAVAQESFPGMSAHGGDDEEMLLMRFNDDADTTKDKNGNAV